MRYTRLNVVVASTFALAALLVASASAVPPEFHGPFPIHYVVKQLGTAKFETVASRTVECTGGSILGFIISGKHITTGNGITYTGCKSTTFGGLKCQNGATEGEITTPGDLGLLGYIDKNSTPPRVGALLETSNGAINFVSFKCNTILQTETLTVKGEMICEITPVNVLTKDFHITCRQTKGAQEPLSFEGGSKATLLTEGSGQELFAFEQTGLSMLLDMLTLSTTTLLA